MNTNIIAEISKNSGTIKLILEVTNPLETTTIANIHRKYKLENVNFFDLPMGKLLLLHNMELFCNEIRYVEEMDD